MSRITVSQILNGRRRALDDAGNKRFPDSGMHTEHNAYHGTDTTRFRARTAVESAERQAFVDGFNEAIAWVVERIKFQDMAMGALAEGAPEPASRRSKPQSSIRRNLVKKTAADLQGLFKERADGE